MVCSSVRDSRHDGGWPPMIVQLRLSALRRTSRREYLLRFALGGTTTVVAGLIAAAFGPVVGGLFLAFPAIFPASATLVEKHVRERKEKAGLPGCEGARRPQRLTQSARRSAVSGLRSSARSCGLRLAGSPLGLLSRRRQRGSSSRWLRGDCGERCEARPPGKAVQACELLSLMRPTAPCVSTRMLAVVMAVPSDVPTLRYEEHFSQIAAVLDEMVRSRDLGELERSRDPGLDGALTP